MAPNHGCASHLLAPIAGVLHSNTLSEGKLFWPLGGLQTSIVKCGASIHCADSLVHTVSSFDIVE